MYCLKCGRETAEHQVFCKSCLQTMEQYPVRKDAHIHLPKRPTQAQQKKQAHRKRQMSAEEQVIHLKRLLRRMMVCVVILCLVLCLAAAALAKELLEDKALNIVGKNYTIDTTQSE